MKQKTYSTILFILFAFISFSAIAQTKLDPKLFSLHKKTQVFPRAYGVDKKKFDLSILDNLKTPSPNKIVLPYDNMMCLLPPSDIKNHIQVYNLQPTAGGDVYNMPNALPRVELVK